MEKLNNKPLHVEVIMGIVKMVREFRSNPGRLVLLSDAMLVGMENVRPEVIGHIFHFGYAWLKRTPSSMLDKIIAGDYSELWAVVNAYLFRAGHPAITPEVIEV